jgi:hypothetical protein
MDKVQNNKQFQQNPTYQAHKEQEIIGWNPSFEFWYENDLHDK